MEYADLGWSRLEYVGVSIGCGVQSGNDGHVIGPDCKNSSWILHYPDWYSGIWRTENIQSGVIHPGHLIILEMCACESGACLSTPEGQMPPVRMANSGLSNAVLVWLLLSQIILPTIAASRHCQKLSQKAWNNSALASSGGEKIRAGFIDQS